MKDPTLGLLTAGLSEHQTLPVLVLFVCFPLLEDILPVGNLWKLLEDVDCLSDPSPGFVASVSQGEVESRFQEDGEGGTEVFLLDGVPPALAEWGEACVLSTVFSLILRDFLVK